jgi:hypothetical protein
MGESPMRCALVSAVSAVFALASAVATPSRARANGEEPIQDNSFLVEEAYNQEPGVIQHISAFTRTRAGAWAYSFVEEWPVLGQRHQASVSLGWAGLEAPGSSGFGDVALNYRLQAVGNGDTRVAFAPRLTVLLPTRSAAWGPAAPDFRSTCRSASPSRTASSRTRTSAAPGRRPRSRPAAGAGRSRPSPPGRASSGSRAGA